MIDPDVQILFRTGRLSKEVGSILAFAEEARNRADYDASTVFDTHAAADLIADVDTFVQAVESLLQD